MINKFHAVDVAKWVECDSDEHNDRVRQLTGLTAHCQSYCSLPPHRNAANGELVSVIARPTDNYSVIFLLEFHIKATPQF